MSDCFPAEYEDDDPKSFFFQAETIWNLLVVHVVSFISCVFEMGWLYVICGVYGITLGVMFAGWILYELLVKLNRQSDI